MSRKTSTARREAFFRALAATGNQTIAAERAKVSRSWVTLHRASDPEFRARLEAAVAEARAAFAKLRADGGGGAPPSGWGSLDGEELVVRGANGRRAQVARARLRQWTPRAETRFLATLAATCNVKAACAEVGLSVPGAYAHRHRWPEFARRWDAAVEEGGMRLEIGLMQRACNLFSPDEQVLEAEGARLPPMTVDQAMLTLAQYRKRLHGVGKTAGRWRRPRTLDEVRDSILRKIEAIENARRFDPQALAADKAQWARRR